MLFKGRAHEVELPVPYAFPPTLAGLAAWLRTQRPETRYDMWNGQTCLLARFARAVTGKSDMCWSNVLMLLHGGLWEAPTPESGKFGIIAYGNGNHDDHNYGAALKRAEEFGL